MAPETILCVDDDVPVLNMIGRILRSEGYSVFTAVDGEQGLSILEAHPVQVVVSDQTMPGMLGTEFLKRVKDRYPETIRISWSSGAQPEDISNALQTGAVHRFVPKSNDIDDLIEVVREAFNDYNARHGT